MAAKKKAAAKPPAPAKPVVGLTVTCRGDSFWRAGRHWTSKPITVALEDLTEEQIEQLKAEPMLMVEDVEI